MNRIIQSLLLVGAVAVSAAASAQDVRVGFVNIESVLEQAPQAEAARTKIEKEFAPRDRELVLLQKEIRQDNERLEKDEAIMSEEDARRLRRELRSKRRELKRLTDEFREDLNLRRNQELADLQREVLEVIQELAREGEYDLIIRDALFHSKRVDVSEQVVERLRRDFEAGR